MHSFLNRESRLASGASLGVLLIGCGMRCTLGNTLFTNNPAKNELTDSKKETMPSLRMTRL
mgnify:CR=1 FL=1